MVKQLKKAYSESGQTTIEYILVLSVVFLIGILLWNRFGTLMADTFGSLNENLSQELSTGYCPSRCFYSGYVNAKK